jgi:hypothetical protein
MAQVIVPSHFPSARSARMRDNTSDASKPAMVPFNSSWNDPHREDRVGEVLPAGFAGGKFRKEPVASLPPCRL